MPEPRRYLRPTQAHSSLPHQIRAQLLLHNVPALQRHGRRHLSTPERSRSTRSRGINSFAAGEASSPSCTNPSGQDSSALRGDTNGIDSTTGPTSFAIGRALLRSTARSTAYTARCGSGPHTANYRGPGAKSSSRPATDSSRAASGLAASALQLFRPGHTFGTRRAMTSGDWAKSPIAPQRTTNQPTPTSSASSTTQGRSRSTTRPHFATLHGAPSKVAGPFSVIRPDDWLAECYGMLMDPVEPPTPPLIDG